MDILKEMQLARKKPQEKKQKAPEPFIACSSYGGILSRRGRARKGVKSNDRGDVERT
jgi:hypothetical protein